MNTFSLTYLDEVWTHPVIRNSDGAEETDVRKEEVPQDGIQLQLGQANSAFKTVDSQGCSTGNLSDAVTGPVDETIDGGNYMQVAAHPEATDLQFLETLLNNIPAEERFGPSYDYRQLLQIASRVFAIGEQFKALTDEVDDVTFTFSQTLAAITVTTSETDTEMHWIKFGRGWVDPPMLTRLEIQSDFARLDVHPELLSHCPNVTYVRLSDRTYGYRCKNIVPCQTVHHSHVETLTLTGWSTCFRLGGPSFSNKPTKLKVTLELDSEDECFIPPPGGLKWSYGIDDDSRVSTESKEPPAVLRPRWTWDWYLLCLTDLQ
ncbi:hypothetical protein BGX30_000515 [Mortierella sp. GBA39]|nr:hypothetical protein BGX30_000515 [Mortierella sp. GBA39]